MESKTTQTSKYWLLIISCLLITVSGFAQQNWNRTGNTNPDWPPNILGTLYPAEVNFWTNSTQRMRLTTDGDLGIGTITPISLFNIHSAGDNSGSIFMTTPSDLDGFKFGTTGTGDYDIAGFGQQVPMQFRVKNASGDMITPILIRPIGSGRANVGIGRFESTTPEAQTTLHLHEGGTSTLLKWTHGGSGATNTDGVDFRLQSSGKFTLINNETGGFEFWTNTSTAAMNIFSDGKVGLGLLAASENLHVKDYIRSNALGAASTAGGLGANNGLVVSDTDGKLHTRIAFNGDNTQVLSGDGSFINLPAQSASLDGVVTGMTIVGNGSKSVIINRSNGLPDVVANFFDQDEICTSVNVTGTTTKTISIARTGGLPNLVATFTDETGAGGGSADADFYTAGTTTAPTTIGDDIYTNGKLGLGTSTPTADLHLKDVGNNGNTRLFIESNNGSNGTGNIGAHVKGHLNGVSTDIIMLVENSPLGTSSPHTASVFRAQGGVAGVPIIGVDVHPSGVVGIGRKADIKGNSPDANHRNALSVTVPAVNLAGGFGVTKHTGIYVENLYEEPTNGLTKYGLKVISTGDFGSAQSSAKNYGIFSDVSGSFNNYSAVFMGGNVGIGTLTPTSTLYVVGDIYATGAVTAFSDARFKENIEDLDNALDMVMNLRGTRYMMNQVDFPDHKFSDRPQIGFIAQELEEVVPELVLTDDAGYKSVDYMKITPLLVEAIKEQQAMIDEQQIQMQEVRASNQQLADELADLMTYLGYQQVNNEGGSTSIGGTETPGNLPAHTDEFGNELSQNVPNPFEAQTRISYQLTSAGQVSLNIYNDQGNLVHSLLNEYQEAGKYSQNWIPENLSTGVYIYVLNVDGSDLVRKAIYLK